MYVYNVSTLCILMFLVYMRVRRPVVYAVAVSRPNKR